MRYIVTLFWAVLLGQVVGFLGGALTSTPYDFTWTLICSIIVGLFIIIIGKVAVPNHKTTH
ncbi:YjzD family protein [Enterococcus olivae]